MKKNTKELKAKEKGITLISLVITIIVLLILARSKYSNFNWKEWNFNKSNECKTRVLNCYRSGRKLEYAM